MGESTSACGCGCLLPLFVATVFAFGLKARKTSIVRLFNMNCATVWLQQIKVLTTLKLCDNVVLPETCSRGVCIHVTFYVIYDIFSC